MSLSVQYTLSSDDLEHSAILTSILSSRAEGQSKTERGMDKHWHWFKRWKTMRMRGKRRSSCVWKKSSTEKEEAPMCHACRSRTTHIHLAAYMHLVFHMCVRGLYRNTKFCLSRDERNFHILKDGEVIPAYIWFNVNFMLTRTACLRARQTCFVHLL